MSEVAAPENYQEKFDEKVNAILKVLDGLSSQYAKSLLESAISRLPGQSYVQCQTLTQ